MIAIHPVQLRQLAPHADRNKPLFENAAEVLFDYAINATSRRLSHFFAQVLHETKGLRVFAENLDYSAERLVERWPKQFPTLSDALAYAHNPIPLANKVYGGRMGNRQAGDGWRYIGRGLLSISGRAMYERISQTLDADLVGRPELVNTPRYALPAACEVWKAANGNVLADRNDLIRLTRALSGGIDGLASRTSWLVKTRQVWPRKH
jgi:putative chitinase